MNDTTKAAADAVALLYEIDDIARGYCEHEYGLPMGDIIAIAQMRAAIEAAIERARADERNRCKRACLSAGEAAAQSYGDGAECLATAELCAAAIEALGTTGEHHE